MLVHDDCPRISWKLAIIEELLEGKDGLVRAANIRTANGRTNRPIARLIPLEVVSNTTATGGDDNTRPDNTHPNSSETEGARRPKRRAAERGRDRVRSWAKELGGAPEDVTD